MDGRDADGEGGAVTQQGAGVRPPVPAVPCSCFTANLWEGPGRPPGVKAKKRGGRSWEAAEGNVGNPKGQKGDCQVCTLARLGNVLQSTGKTKNSFENLSEMDFDELNGSL